MVELVALCIETRFDVAQALPVGELREGHASVLILAAETFDVPVAVVALNAAPKGMQRQVIQRLREYEFACVHDLIAPTRKTGWKRAPGSEASSSR